jgi:aromatase
MPRIQHSVRIAEEPRVVFDITNDIDSWHMLFDEYGESKVIRREEAGRFTKLVFRLRNNEGNEWQSWRILDHQDLVAIAARDAPLFPFVYMHLMWTYEAIDGGTLMTWTQDFELDPGLDTPEDVVAQRMDQHGRGNQERIRRIIESGQLAREAAGSRATPIGEAPR